MENQPPRLGYRDRMPQSKRNFIDKLKRTHAPGGPSPMRQSLILTSLSFGLFLGCDTAARQQQAEDARRRQTVDEFRELGEETHSNQEGVTTQ
jgi:hypothetical protein